MFNYLMENRGEKRILLLKVILQSKKHLVGI